MFLNEGGEGIVLRVGYWGNGIVASLWTGGLLEISGNSKAFHIFGVLLNIYWIEKSNINDWILWF